MTEAIDNAPSLISLHADIITLPTKQYDELFNLLSQLESLKNILPADGFKELAKLHSQLISIADAIPIEKFKELTGLVKKLGIEMATGTAAAPPRADMMTIDPSNVDVRGLMLGGETEAGLLQQQIAQDQRRNNLLETIADNWRN
jgi:hypothetical protein